MKKEISQEQVKVIQMFAAHPEEWFSSSDVVRHCEVKPSTVIHLLLGFCRDGLLERFELFPGFRYRLSPSAPSHPYFVKVQQAAEVMGESN
jgi:DNA-binding IclR family transcriptional regulator